MAADGVCIGDHVCLFSEEGYSNGYVYGTQSSKVHNELAVKPRQNREKPDVPDPQVISFRICVANRYKLSKKYRKLKEASDANASDLNKKAQASSAQIGADAEEEDNVAEQKRQQGKKVLYGQIVQLQHIFTNKYLHVSTTQTSHTETSNMQVMLLDYNAKHAQFRLMPRYKVKSEGDMVQVDDQVVLESLKSPGQFLHVSNRQFTGASVYKGSHELNLSVRQSGFTVSRVYKPDKDHNAFVKTSLPIRLFHREMEAYLVAEGVFDSYVLQDVHLRVRPMDQSNPRTLFPSTSAITYWQVEMQEGVTNGNIVRWEQQVRFKHMTTRRYLVVDAGGKVGLTDDHQDPKTVFRLHPVIQEKDEIEYETYCRIEHVVSHSWLHAMSDEYVRKSGGKDDGKDTSMTGLQWTTANLKQIGMSADMQYDDAFTMQQVMSNHVDIFNYMAGMVPFLQKIIADKKAGEQLNAKQAHDVLIALREMKDFMIVNSVPNKDRQKLLRNLRIVELLVQLLQVPIRGSPDQRHLTSILVECYDVLYTYLMGDSRKNELYIAKHISFFETQISFEGEIGLNAAHMVMELIKDNRKIVDRIEHKHIDNFVELLSKNKNYRYLDLLSVLCVCDGISIPDNQIYITDSWLKKGRKNCVFHTEMGEQIGKETGKVYVSTNGQRTWTKLQDFVQQKDLRKDEEFLFLDHQLDLFGKLCYGRNEYAISVITEELKYLTWEEAFSCLTNEALPDQLRAKYCSLIIGLFVDVGENMSLLDNISLTFVYDEIGDGKDHQHALQTAREHSVTKRYFPFLRDWIAGFLDENKDMTASLIGHNMLVAQVLRLVHYLVKFGFFGNIADIKALLTPMINLIDGRNDKPYPKVANQSEMSDVVERYRTVTRYQQSPETKAIVDAKYQAMEVLDLFFNFRFNKRLEQFIQEYKETYRRAHHDVGISPPELGPLLSDSYDIYDNPQTNKHAIAKLKEIFDASSYFQGLGVNLVEVLLDLSHYEYDKMVVQSMHLLNRYYSAHDNLFKRAVQAQVLITDGSVAVLRELEEILPVITRLKAAKMSAEQTEKMNGMLDRLIRMCSLEDEPEERHPMNQNILYNHDVVPLVFDILSQEIDVGLLTQYDGTRKTFEKCFTLLRVMARGNHTIQMRLFDRMDLLLNIQGAEVQMALALAEVFTGNKHTCLKILPTQVQRIMQLVQTHDTKVPHLLDLLNTIVKVEELDLPLKRNQGYVMKYFMQYRSEVAQLIDQPADARRRLLEGKGDSPQLDYLISLVDLLATCAEGENRFIESICQTIFPISELLDVLNDKSVDSNLKRPYARFFLWVYLNTASGMIDSGSGDLPHDEKMWEFLMSLNDLFASLAKYATDEPNMVKQLLRKPPSKSEQAGHTDWKVHHGSLHYVFEAIMPLLQVFFGTYYQQDSENYPNETQEVNKLAESLVNFTNAVGPLVKNESHMKTMVSCMNVLLSSSTLPTQVMEEFQGKYGAGQGAARHDTRSDARKVYEEAYQQEEELNSQLNIFAINYSAAYGGFNDLKSQIGFNSDKEYSEIGGDEELPLGYEFQKHMACFIDSKQKDPYLKYRMAGKLVEQLDISASYTHQNEQLRLKQEELDIKCLQLLRGIIHNESVKLPDDWESNIKLNRKALKQIEDVQNALNKENAMLRTLPHLSKNSDDIVREVLAFLSAMLFCGNEEVQQKMIDYFLGTREETFFFAVKNRMQLSSVATKEKRALMAQHQSKLEEAIEQAKALRKAMKSGNANAQTLLATNPMGSALLGSRMSLMNKGKGKKKSSQMLKARYGNQSRMGSERSLQGSQFLGALEGGGSQMFGSPSGTTSLMVPGGGATNYGAVVPMEEKPNGVELRSIMGAKKDDKTPLINKDNKVGPMHASVPEVQVEEVDDAEIEEMAYLALQNSMELEYKDDGFIELVLKMLGLMCDGQNKILQDYLREQPDNIKSVNLVAETARFLSLVYSSINKNTMGLVCELFQTLVEFTSGNPNNQLVIFDNKVCDYVNFILRGATFKGCNNKEIMKLKFVIGTLITALTEENTLTSDPHHPQGVGKEVVGALDEESIWQVAVDCYNHANDKQYLQRMAEVALQENPKGNIEKLVEEERDLVLNVGFKYFHVICRMIDLDDHQEISKSHLLKCQEDQDIWDFYMDGTLTVELVKNDQLQKLYYRCRDSTVLREEVKEKFKYEVDRSSPSNKLREFMDWSKDIMQDIKYTRRVMNNPLLSFFVKYWWHFNVGMIFMSFVFFVLILVTWKEPLLENGDRDFNNARPDFIGNAWAVQVVIWVLGGIHNLLSLCVLISYFITNHPTFPKVKNIKKVFQRAKRFGQEDDDDDDDDEGDRESHLEVKFFSIMTIWYIIMFVASILGTIFWGYFFAIHLLHLANFNQLLKRAIQAVTKNGISLVMVFLYGLVFFYIYTLISFAAYRNLYDQAKGEFCGTMYQCYLTLIHRGLITGLYDFLEVPEGLPFSYHVHKAFFDITFFIIITTIGLNIIFGIIVDTFSELRDNKWQVDNDMNTTCFICSRNSYDFEHQGGGFEMHVKTEHNQWAYLFFFIHLDETRPNDYTALELHVSRLLVKENYDFFPLNRALSLQHEEDSNEQKLETLMSQVTYLVNKMREEESVKQREEERKRQLEWEKQHKK